MLAVGGPEQVEALRKSNRRFASILKQADDSFSTRTPDQKLLASGTPLSDGTSASCTAGASTGSRRPG